jgi:hypothetical protein
MAYQLRILAGFADTEPAALLGEVEAAISAAGSWERLFEVRMGAGPTVRIACGDNVGYVVSVSWGSQSAHFNVRTLLSAIECADRIAYVFYEMRDAEMIQG